MSQRITSVLPQGLDVLAPFVTAGVFNDAEIQLSAAVARLASASGASVSPEVLLAVAVAARGPRSGHVCIDLSRVADLLVDEDSTGEPLPWPDSDPWLRALRADAEVVSTPETAGVDPVRPLVLDGTRLYLQRYWDAEEQVADEILTRSGTPSSLRFDDAALDEALGRYFGPEITEGEIDWQRRGAAAALENSFSVLAGGPGTGKTRTVARMLATAHSIANAQGRHLLVGLAAPSGKAAARMAEAIEQAVEQLVADQLIDETLAQQLRNTQAVTIHRLLGANPRWGFAHDASNPLAFDIVIVDESSMISLPLMAALLEAVPTKCHLVLVGDPDQLASVQAGTVLGDIVRPAVSTAISAPGTCDGSTDAPAGARKDAADAPAGALNDQITVLRVARRFRSDSAIAALAQAVRTGDIDSTLAILGSAGDEVTWIRPDERARLGDLVHLAVDNAVRTVEASRAGDVDAALGTLGSTKVLTATHHHPLGLRDWSERIERGLFSAIDGDQIRIPWSSWYIGRPVIVTRNDSLLRVYNGDVGITVDREGTTTVVMDGNPENRLEIQAARLDEIETWWAMTIHKSQGSEFDHVIVSLPPPWVPILTRELLYTAITRARSKVTVVGTEEAIRTAVERPISRASGLQDRLWSTSIDHTG